MDSKLKQALRKHKEVPVIISYQVRDTGNFALARIYDRNKDTRNAL